MNDTESDWPFDLPPSAVPKEEPKQVQAPETVWVRWDVFGNPHAEPGPHYPNAVRYVKAGGQ